MRMRTLAWTLLLAAGLARADIWECVDERTGQKMFTNIRSESKGCKALSVTTPAPARGGKAATAPANFPSVDAPTQRARDGDRRKILEQELGNEERMLADARRQLEAQKGLLAVEGKAPAPERLGPYQKQVQLHENNVANLRKELANLR